MKRLFDKIYACGLLSVILCFAAFPAGSEEQNPLYSPEILVVASDEEAWELENRGVVIWHRRADMALALMPLDAGSKIKEKDSGGSRSNLFPRKALPMMDIAKTYLDAAAIAEGRGLPRPYTGKGVVVGFCDIAFDPNHVNFKDSEGKSRVKKLIYYDEPMGIRTILDTEAEIAAWTTDYDGAYHGTHVAGIMTGSYNENGYGGMAPEAEIVAATSQLYDVGLLAACEEIIGYAQSVGKPAVINLSVGSYNGPHDGSTLFNRYLSLLGKEAVICIAAGNAGDDHNSYRAVFSSEVPSWRVALQGNDWIHFNIFGMTDAWSHDSRPVNARFVVYDTDTATGVYESPLVDFSKVSEYTLCSDDDANLAQFMTGEIRFRGRVDALNGRWVTEVEYDTRSTATAAASDGKWARYRPALEFSAEPGVHADINADGQYSFLRSYSGYPSPNAELSISDLSTGDNIIVVGMYNNRNRIPTLGGTDRTFSFEPFTVNEGSGYGTLIDGRRLPHVVAPGGGVVSSSNRYYTLAHPEFIPRMNAKAVVDGETYYWASDAGTSMATPYVAGCVATWLEANPNLTVSGILEIMGATNFLDYPDPMNPRHGHGWLSPYAGLKEAIRVSGISSAVPEQGDIRIVREGGNVEVLNPSGRRVTVSVMNAAGVQALSSVENSEAVISLSVSGLPRGIYILSASTPGLPPVTLKLALFE